MSSLTLHLVDFRIQKEMDKKKTQVETAAFSASIDFDA